MRKILHLLFVVLLMQTAKAQTWCTPGAEWHYRVYSPSTMFYQDGYIKVNVASSYTVAGLVYYVLNGTYHGRRFTPNGPIQTLNAFAGTTYENNGVIYISRPDSTLVFDTIANFNASIGDKWLMTRVSYPCHPLISSTLRPSLTVIDTGHVYINGIPLKKILLQQSSQPALTFLIIEKISSVSGFMFPYYQCVLDEPFLGGFVCYSDNNFPLYQNPGYNQPCDFSFWNTVGQEEIISGSSTGLASDISIYPNPANSMVNFKPSTGVNSNFMIKILSISGLKMEQFDLSAKEDFQINTSKYTPGLYFIEVLQEGKAIEIKKLLIER